MAASTQQAHLYVKEHKRRVLCQRVCLQYSTSRDVSIVRWESLRLRSQMLVHTGAQGENIVTEQGAAIALPLGVWTGSIACCSDVHVRRACPTYRTIAYMCNRPAYTKKRHKEIQCGHVLSTSLYSKRDQGISLYIHSVVCRNVCIWYASKRGPCTCTDQYIYKYAFICILSTDLLHVHKIALGCTPCIYLWYSYLLRQVLSNTYKALNCTRLGP